VILYVIYIGCIHWDGFGALPPFAIQPNRDFLAGYSTASDKWLTAKAKVGVDALVPLSGTQMRGRGTERQNPLYEEALCSYLL
jgi:hypothetical protein